MSALPRKVGWLVLAIVLLLGAAGGASRAGAQTAPAAQSEPARDAVLTAPPPRIDLSFMDLVDPAGPATIRLVASDGRVIPLAAPRIDPDNQRQIGAAIAEALPAGTYTVLWSATFAAPATAATPGAGAPEGVVRTGSFAFRIAPAAAGAAEPGETWPAAWGVAARWLIWAGAALAAGGALLGFLRQAGPATTSATSATRRIGAVALGGTVALLATLAQPLLLRLTAGAAGPMSLGEAFGLMGPGWLATLAATALLALLGLGALAGGFANRPSPRAVALIPLALALVAAAGLALTGLQGVAATPGPIAVAARLLHDWAALLLLAAVVAALLARSTAGSGGVDWRWLGRLGLGAAAVAVVAGVVDAGMALPSLDALASAWGGTLLAKAALAVGLVAFAAFGSTRARRSAKTGSFAVAAGFSALTLLAGSTLTLMAAPGAPAGALAQLELAAPLSAALPELGPTPGLVHLTLQPTTPGGNAATVRLTDAAGALPAHLPAVAVHFSPLDHDAPSATLDAPLDPADGAATGAIALPGPGWWAAEVAVTSRDGTKAGMTFYFVTPDPNVTGAGPRPADDPQAKAVFERGLAGMTSLKNVRFAQILGDGGGSVYESQSVVTSNPPAYEERSANATVIVADGQQWIKAGDAPWSVSPAASIPLPSTWGASYTPVGGFRLGPVETVDGEPCQVVTFYHLNEAGRQWAPTWYAWWVGQQSGRVRREAMVSTRHYMIYDYNAFDEPATIAPPAGANATPAP